MVQSTLENKVVTATGAGKSTVPVSTSEVELLGSVLTRAFYSDPRAEYILPYAETRGAVLSWLFDSAIIAAGRLWDDVYTIQDASGVALWVRPGSELTLERFLINGAISLPLNFDRSSIMRWIHVIRYFKCVRRSVMDKQYWRLIALRADASRPSNHGELVDPILTKADSEHRPCYVETFDDNELPFYAQRGFRIIGAGKIPKDGPKFWALVRPPRPWPQGALRFRSGDAHRIIKC